MIHFKPSFQPVTHIYNNRHRQLIQMRSSSPFPDSDAAQGWSQPCRLALASQRCWVEGEGIVERGRQKQNTSPVATAPVGRGEGWPAQKAMTNSLKGSGVAQKRAAFTLPRFPDFQFGRTGGGGVNPTGTDRANNTPTIPSFLPSPCLLLVDGPRRALEDDSTGLIA